MANHHDNHHSEEQKPVAFTVPFILATVTIIAMLLLLSLCNPKHGHCECKEDCSKECMEACEKGDHSKHPAMHDAGHSVKATEEEHAPKENMAPAHDAASDTTKKEEAHH